MNKKESPLAMNAKKATASVLSSLACIFIGLILGYVFLLILNAKYAWSDGLWPIIKGGFKSFGNEQLVKTRAHMKPLAMVIAEGAPLIMTGLSVAFAFKTGLFNIGAAGQYVLGAFAGLYCALVLHLPWYLCLLAATLAGAIWGALPGILKAFLNVNEVITCIMLNWIGLYGANTLMYQGGNSPMYFIKQAKTYTVASQSPRSLIPSNLFGWDLTKTFNYSAMTIAILLAVIAAAIIYIILNKTTFGYELKACGHNKNAATYAGINAKRNIVLSMVIAGALAGFGAGLFYLSGIEQYNPQESTALPAQGFNGISVALLASLNPIGCIFSGIFISHLSVGGNAMTQSIFPKEISDAVSGIIVYLCAFSMIFKGFFSKLIGGALFKKRGGDQS